MLFFGYSNDEIMVEAPTSMINYYGIVGLIGFDSGYIWTYYFTSFPLCPTPSNSWSNSISSMGCKVYLIIADPNFQRSVLFFF